MSRQFRLLSGDHIHEGRLCTPGQILVSNLDLCEMFNQPGYRPKFEDIAGTTGAGNMVWDPKVESIDAFAERMRRMPPPTKEGPAMVWDPKVESLAEFTARMARLTGQQPMNPGQDVSVDLDDMKRRMDEVLGKQHGGAEPLQGGAVTAVATLKTQAQLEAMSLDDLRKHAEGEEIDLGHARSKGEVIKVIRAWQGAIQGN